MLGVPILRDGHLVLRHVEVNVVSDDGYVYLPVVTRCVRVGPAAVDLEPEIRGQVVVEQLDSLAVGREDGRDAGVVGVVVDVEAPRATARETRRDSRPRLRCCRRARPRAAARRRPETSRPRLRLARQVRRRAFAKTLCSRQRLA
jgi:hypothetical protein